MRRKERLGQRRCSDGGGRQQSRRPGSRAGHGLQHTDREEDAPQGAHVHAAVGEPPWRGDAAGCRLQYGHGRLRSSCSASSCSPPAPALLHGRAAHLPSSSDSPSSTGQRAGQSWEAFALRVLLSMKEPHARCCACVCLRQQDRQDAPPNRAGAAEHSAGLAPHPDNARRCDATPKHFFRRRVL